MIQGHLWLVLDVSLPTGILSLLKVIIIKRVLLRESIFPQIIKASFTCYTDQFHAVWFNEFLAKMQASISVKAS